MRKDSGEFGEKDKWVKQKESPDHSRRNGIGGRMMAVGRAKTGIIVISAKR